LRPVATVSPAGKVRVDYRADTGTAEPTGASTVGGIVRFPQLQN
jgi:hypothetical protein